MKTLLLIILLWIACIIGVLIPPLGIIFLIFGIIWAFQQPNPWGKKTKQRVIVTKKIEIEPREEKRDLPSKIENLISSLSDEDSEFNDKVIKSLVAIGEPAVDPLIKSFEKKPAIQHLIIKILGKIGNSAAVDFLNSLVKSKTGEIRLDIARALIDTHDDRVNSSLIALLEDDDYFVRNEALSLFSMGRRKDKRAVEPLIKLLKDKSLRQEAVHALGYLNDSRAVEPLTSILLKDKNWMAREGAAWALKEIKDNRAVGALILALQDNIGKVRSMSAWALQEIADSKALLPLKKAFLEEEDTDVKNSIESAMGALERKEKGIAEREVGVSDSENVITERTMTDEYRERMINVIKNNPGILQTDLYKQGFDSFGCYTLERQGYIKREKAGNTYKLFLEDDSSKIKLRKFLMRSWDERVKIPLETYPDTEERVIKYFGTAALKTLFKFSDCAARWREYNKSFGGQSEKVASLDWRTDASDGEAFFNGNKEDNVYPYFFLLALGDGLDLVMNDHLVKVVSKYCDKGLENSFREVYNKYGFFIGRELIEIKLAEILGKEQLLNFYAELEQKAPDFKVWCCGHSLLSVTSSRNLPLYYVKYLKFKWGLKPEISIKKCVCCQEFFYPFYYASDFFPYTIHISQIYRYFPIEKSIKEVNFCPEHFPTSSYGTFFKDEIDNDPKIEHRMKELLKKLVDTLEFIPPKSFHKSLHYLKRLPKDKFDKAIKLISNMPPLKKVGPSQPKGYQDVFGSWLQALDAAGVLEGGVRKTRRGYICLAKDGHECRSIGEKIVDDYLYTHNIPHEKEPSYPGEKKFRADWKVGKYFIELWGLAGEEDYDRKMHEKKDILQKYRIPLIEIIFSDLRTLDKIFKNVEIE